jgi:hypothetical protein
MAAFDDMDNWKDIFPRIHIREFSVGRKFETTDPQHHGDFGRITFWNPDCWKTNPEHPELCYGAPLAPACSSGQDCAGSIP